MKRMLEFLGVVAVVAALIILSYKIGQKRGKTTFVTNEIVKTDTLVVFDTFVVHKPCFVEKKVIDTVLISTRDTATIHDTLYVRMQREQVCWRDSLSIVYASGIMPEVDSVYHFIPTRIVTNDYARNNKWGVGLQIGVGASKQGLSPYIGVGLSYNFLAF